MKKVIAESIDTALESFDYVDREKFYHILGTKYGLKVEDIPDRYELFHSVLSEMFGIKHYAVERKIVAILHGRSKTGVYDEAHEIPAFAILIESYVAEVDQQVLNNKAQIEKNLKALAKIKKTHP